MTGKKVFLSTKTKGIRDISLFNTRFPDRGIKEL